MRFVLFLFAVSGAFAADPIAIGSRRELFVDDFLIEKMTGKAGQRLHHPQPREIAITHDAPWEGSGSVYHTVFKDGDKYRMYYRGSHLGQDGGRLKTNDHPMFYCYAESRDGSRWTKPELGLHDFHGSKANNIVMAPGRAGSMTLDMENAVFFKDDNPQAAPEARYKALVHSSKPNGLAAFQSADGLHWSLIRAAPVITAGAFDSQNLAFWDAQAGLYRAYWRYFTEGITDEKNWKPSGLRAIRTATSKDFIHWEAPQALRYLDSAGEALYTNQVKPYHRAPHVLIGFPTRYLERGWSASMRALPEREHRAWRSKASDRYGMALTEGLLMTSRDGVTFKRWSEAFLPPGIERPGTWNYGHQYIAWHLVETKSSLEGAPDELSLYATESFWTGKSSELRRYTMRLDGFVSIHAPMSGGEVVTKPLTFTGQALTMNFATSAAGSVKVEIQDADGKPMPGFTLGDCEEHFGDSPARTVVWKNGSAVGALAGKAVRLRFVLQDADLYALKFE